jgi:ParB/RepB/Spo0J family partition protein
VHQPVLLRTLPASRLEDTAHLKPRPQYELVCGERRFRACLAAGLKNIPAMVAELTNDQALEVQVVENLQRTDLSALEEAEGYEVLMQTANITADQVAEKIGKSRAYVYGRIKLLDLGTESREALKTGLIDASRALLLARIPDTALQAKALQEIDKNIDPLKARDEIKRLKEQLAKQEQGGPEIELALHQLIDKICPELDTGNILEDAKTASRKIGLLTKQEQGKPVAYVHADELEELSHCNGMSVWAENALVHTNDSLSKQLLPSGYVALYPGPQQRKPLTDEERAAIWAEGYRIGIVDERISEANIGIAGFDAKVDPARQNPYGIEPQGGGK